MNRSRLAPQHMNVIRDGTPAMLDRIIAFLTDLPGADRKSRESGDDPVIAAVALLFHVIDADGERGQPEMQRLRALVAGRYALSGRELDALLTRAEAADREAIDFYSFTTVLCRHLDPEARKAFIGLMWEMVFADGELHELEDNVVWRVAELMGVERPERIALRRAARAATAGETN